jgi:hypothetical protein
MGHCCRCRLRQAQTDMWERPSADMWERPSADMWKRPSADMWKRPSALRGSLTSHSRASGNLSVVGGRPRLPTRSFCASIAEESWCTGTYTSHVKVTTSLRGVTPSGVRRGNLTARPGVIELQSADAESRAGAIVTSSTSPAMGHYCPCRLRQAQTDMWERPSADMWKRPSADMWKRLALPDSRFEDHPHTDSPAGAKNLSPLPRRNP